MGRLSTGVPSQPLLSRSSLCIASELQAMLSSSSLLEAHAWDSQEEACLAPPVLLILTSGGVHC